MQFVEATFRYRALTTAIDVTLYAFDSVSPSTVVAKTIVNGQVREWTYQDVSDHTPAPLASEGLANDLAILAKQDYDHSVMISQC